MNTFLSASAKKRSDVENSLARAGFAAIPNSRLWAGINAERFQVWAIDYVYADGGARNWFSTDRAFAGTFTAKLQLDLSMEAIK